MGTELAPELTIGPVGLRRWILYERIAKSQGSNPGAGCNFSYGDVKITPVEFSLVFSWRLDFFSVTK